MRPIARDYLAMLTEVYDELGQLPPDLNHLYQTHMQLRHKDYAGREGIRLHHDWPSLKQRLEHLAFGMIVRGKGTVADEGWDAAEALREIGTPEALAALKKRGRSPAHSLSDTVGQPI